MIKLKNLLTEDVNYILKKSPNAIISKAADLMAGVFRIKFKATRDETTPPDFAHDIMYVLTSPKNTQYGPASSFANGDWYYIIGDDRKAGSERRLVTDVLIYPKRKLVSVESGKQRWEEIQSLFKTTPKSSGKVGSSDIIKVSDFVSAIDPKVDRIPETLGTGATLIKQINDILNNTVTDAPDGNEKIVVVKKDGSSDDSKKDDSVVIDKKDGEIKKDDEIKKDEIDGSRRTVITFKQTRDASTGALTLDAGEISLDKNFYISRLNVINNNPDAFTAEAFQQLIVQRVLPVPAYNALSAVQTFKKLKKPADGVWATKSFAVIAELNDAYGINEGDNVTKELLDKLFSPLKTESRFLLKSILLEQDLTGFDPSRVKSSAPITVTAPIKKEVPKSTNPAVKSTTPAVKITPKPAVIPKKEPAKTITATPNKSLKVTTDKPYRRGIENVAKELKAKLRWDAKLKVWYIDREIGISRNWMPDVKAFLHLRDDGTLMLKVYNLMANVYGAALGGISEVKDFVIVRGVGSGWTDSGKKMQVEILLAGKERSVKQIVMEPIELRSPNKKTFNITGSSFLACLQAALKRSKGDLNTVDGFWFPTTDKYGN